jgi:hypothetical protein
MGLQSVLIQAAAVVGISVAAGVAHQAIKPISRSLADYLLNHRTGHEPAQKV